MARFHKVKSHKWIDGKLETKWDFFDSFEAAVAFAQGLFGAQSVKVYTDTNELVHSVEPAAVNTYA